MLKVITPEDHDGMNVRTLVLVFEVPDEQFDLNAAVRAAAKDFCLTEKGRDTYLRTNCHSFNWGDFDLYVSNEFCQKHGFKKLNAFPVDGFTDFNEQLVNEDEIVGEEDE